VLERRAAVEAETRNAQDGEVHREDVAGLAAGKSPGALWTAITLLSGKVAA
jgi:hypothetical protein